MPTSATDESVPAELSLRLRPGPEAVPAARNALDGLSGMLERPVWEDLRLLVTEVVTNGVRHGSERGPVEMSVTVGEAAIRAQVTDGGRGFAPPAAPMPRGDGSGGWGLQLVDRVASRWGVDVDGGTRVWFELSR
jgi:anti-sigma regulatory factor (Ser/Thr protein kinase)